MFIPIDCWLFMPSLSGLPLVPVLLALWSAVPSWVRVLHLRLFRAGRCFLFGFSLGWGWLRLRASVGPFPSLVCLRGRLLLLLLLPRLPFAWRCVLGGQFT